MVAIFPIAGALLATAAIARPGLAGTAAAGTGKVQVYIMMGQSNMLGEGKIGKLGDTRHLNQHQQQKHLTGEACDPSNWWTEASFGSISWRYHGYSAASVAECCAMCASKNQTYWTYQKNATGSSGSYQKKYSDTCWLFSLDEGGHNQTAAHFLKGAIKSVNRTSGSVHPMPAEPHFKPPPPPPPPFLYSLAKAVEAGKYPYLYDASNKSWTVSKTVRNVFTMGGGGPAAKGVIQTNSWMSGGQGHSGSIGPELGIGAMLEQRSPAPTMMLKSCIGNRALGWDLLPPTQKSFDWTDPKNSSLVWTYAGYHQSPARWLKGTTPTPITWVAGCQYDGDLKRADDVLADLGKYYPDATDYEVAGFFWWQGDRDSRSAALTGRYEQNLVALIKALRLHYKVPDAPFVTASLGQSTVPASACPGNCGGGIEQAMMNVADATKYPEFKGNVGFVDTHPLLNTPSSSGSHYGKDALTYMNVGQAMGAAMAKLLKGSQ